MRKFKVTVNGREYDVEVVEVVEDDAARRVTERPATALRPTVPERAPEEAEAASCLESTMERVAAKSAAPVARKQDVPPSPAQRGTAPSEALRRVDAPLAGTILSVRCKPGDRVRAGDVLLTLEALKLENEIASPYSGVVRSVNVSPGESVEAGALLATVEELAS